MADDRIFMPEQSPFSGGPSREQQSQIEASRRAAKEALARGSDTDDIAGGIAGFLTGLGTLIGTGGNLPAAMAAGQGVGEAVGGITKEIEGKEKGGLKQAALGAAGAAKSFGGIKAKPADPMTPGTAEMIIGGEQPKDLTTADPLKRTAFPGVGLFKHLMRGGK